MSLARRVVPTTEKARRTTPGRPLGSTCLSFAAIDRSFPRRVIEGLPLQHDRGGINTPAAHRRMMLSLGRWFLDEMDRLKHFTRVFEHDGQRLAQLTAEVKTNLIDLSNRLAVRLIAALAPETADPEAAAVVVLGPLVAVRR